VNKVRPIFKWAGGKFNCIERIVSALPDGKRLIEPFAGAATVFFNTNYPRYLLAEQNSDLIIFYQSLKQYKIDFIRYCSRYFTAKFNSAEIYYKLREEFNHCQKNKKKRAALFLYLNRHGYNGLCRYNQSGRYNVPFGHHKKVLFPETAMSDFLGRDSEVELICTDFRETFKLAREGDIIYCDPPYVPISSCNKAFNYWKDGFSLEDQCDLAHLAKTASQQGIQVIISNHDTPFTRQQYEGAMIHSFPVRRAISCKGDTRQPVHELLATFSSFG